MLGVLQSLVDKGNTVIVIEHNLDVIKTSDWVVDMGPHGGRGGGLIVAEGTPEQVAAHATSYTGEFLRPLVTPAEPVRTPRKRAAEQTAGDEEKAASARGPARGSARRPTRGTAKAS